MLQALRDLKHAIFLDTMLQNVPKETPSTPQIWVSMSRIFGPLGLFQFKSKTFNSNKTDQKEIPINETDWKPPTIISLIDDERNIPQTSKSLQFDHEKKNSKTLTTKTINEEVLLLQQRGETNRDRGSPTSSSDK
ncbi:hypothetical protein NPIL_182131 [Nephila pilipes]|uniref:Uncharacterized protein n=1 Tax=Nephila pilipes TaxID=299642 RepID=A0A8X6I4N2_NEPPI|nr:hypothetical protein NPIL_182131 [Nephila pilipes]